MPETKSSTVWIAATPLLLVPLLYVGSYLALALPFARLVPIRGQPGSYEVSHYRFGGAYAETLYWPLERLDRHLRPQAWFEPIYH